MKNLEVLKVQRPFKGSKYEKTIIGFFDDDYEGVLLPHSDALVVTLTIANQKIHRILVDTRSSANILYKTAFDLVKIDRRNMVLIFDGVIVKGTIIHTHPPASIGLPY
jgi:hypothetical protein